MIWGLVYVAEKLRTMEEPRLQRRFELMTEVERLYPRRPKLARLGALMVRAGARLQQWSERRHHWHPAMDNPTNLAAAGD